MAMQADKAHAQGGFVGWAHFPYPKGEVAIDVALGKVDSVDLLSWGDAFAPRGKNLPGPSEVYYRFLNCGFDLPATAGTDKMWNTMVVGMPRTYVKIEGDLTYRKWIEGIRAGRTFVTTGPVLFFQADGHQLGETVQLPKGKKVTLTAQVHSRVPVQKVEILQDEPIRRRRFLTETTAGFPSWPTPVPFTSRLATNPAAPPKMPPTLSSGWMRPWNGSRSGLTYPFRSSGRKCGRSFSEPAGYLRAS